MNVEQLTQLIQNKLQLERDNANRFFAEGNVEEFMAFEKRIEDLVAILNKLVPPPPVEPEPDPESQP